MGRASRRDELVDAAVRVFSRRGFHASGIEAVLSEAGVSKMALYNHFKSKDDLIAAAIQRWDQDFCDALVRRIDLSGDDPRDRLSTFFDALGDWFDDEQFTGCLAQSACAEFGPEAVGVRAAARAHRQRLVQIISSLLAPLADGRVPLAELSERVLLIVNGATASARATCERGERRAAAERARTLVHEIVGP